MAGGRKLDSVSEIRARLRPPAFDQHPRHTGPLLVVGMRSVKRGGWQVAVVPRSSAPHLDQTIIALDPQQARALAEELTQMADICDGGRW